MINNPNPEIIDNYEINAADALNQFIPQAEFLDISSGYFELSGYALLRQTLEQSIKKDDFVFRLMVGQDAIKIPVLETFEEYKNRAMPSTLDSSINELELSHKNQNLMTDLISLLEKKNVHVRHNDARFNHSKCYILGTRMAMIGSSNFTGSGFESNGELNAAIYQPSYIENISKWFERMWSKAEDSKHEIILLLKSSKFGIPPDPYEVYTKMLFERYRQELKAMKDAHSTKSENLTKFQKDAVINAIRIIIESGGVMIADSTGLGKTHMGIELIRQKRHMENKKVLLIAPSQVLNSVWEPKLDVAGIKIKTESMEKLGREDYDLKKYNKIQVIVVDESQNFRSKNAGRRKNLMKILSGRKKEVILLSATPVNNSIMDLYYQIKIISGNKQDKFRSIGIPHLKRHMRDAANKGIETGLGEIERLLDAIMIKRTKSFIKEVYPNEKLNGREIKFPKREYAPINYDIMEATGVDIYDNLIETIDKLKMVPYGIDSYNTTLSDEERQKKKTLASLQTILLLKRFESSTHAGKKSIDNKIRLYEHFRKSINLNKIPRVKDLNKIMTEWRNAGVDDMDVNDEWFIEKIEALDTEDAKNYQLKQMKDDLKSDLQLLQTYRQNIEKIIRFDKKFQAVAEKIQKDEALEKDGKKVLIFTEYADTAIHVRDRLRETFPNYTTEMITGAVKKECRPNILYEFSPKSNSSEDGNIPKKQVDILVSTEVLSEGQNLQDCNYVINYDLPWNPMRIVQRIGRVDRLTSTFDIVYSRECFPAKNLEKLLKLKGKLLKKLHTIKDSVGIDEGILGQDPNPKVFNSDMDDIMILADDKKNPQKMMEDRERTSDLLPITSPFNEINQHLRETGFEEMAKIPMGRRSGIKGETDGVVVCYIAEKDEKRRFYSVLYDTSKNTAVIIENSEAFRIISCLPKIESYIPGDKKDGSYSFEKLVSVDVLARDTIEKFRTIKMDTDVLLQLEEKYSTKFSKDVDNITDIIITAYSNGLIEEAKGESILEILKAPDLKSWQKEISNIISNYNNSTNLDELISGIYSISEQTGITAPTVEDDEMINAKLVLVGAMFISK